MKAITYPSTNEMVIRLPRPRKFTLVAASAEGKTELTAFDKALLLAGVGNTNLLKVSSILPPDADYVSELSIKPGSFLPIAYSSLTCSQPGKLISASVGVGISSRGHYGVIMEFSGFCSKKDAEETVSEMVKEAFEVRGLPLNQLFVKGVEHKVKNIGCVFAAVPLWY
ncbi:MAG: arginine decarboxylase, pyruvoyl-dependent [Thermodesulfovibrionales bacterium]|nr:arginine decarboxylase, pyruvoyl-dependent [Thermodesulfovibrionales bacterium]